MLENFALIPTKIVYSNYPKN